MVAALIAAELGRGTAAVREVRRATRMALWLAVAVRPCGMALLCQFGEAIMLLAGQDAGDRRAGGRVPARCSCWALIPMLIANVLRSFVSALGRPVFATAIAGARGRESTRSATTRLSSATSARRRWASKARRWRAI